MEESNNTDEKAIVLAETRALAKPPLAKGSWMRRVPNALVPAVLGSAAITVTTTTVLWLAGVITGASAALFLGTLANVVMAGAAIGAFSLWRRQLRGQVKHDLAVRVLRTAHRMESATRHTLHKTMVTSAFGLLDLVDKEGQRGIDRWVEQMREVTDEWTDLRADVQTIWGRDEASMVLNPLDRLIGEWYGALDIMAVASASIQEPPGPDPEDPDDWTWTWAGVFRGQKPDVEVFRERVRVEVEAVREWSKRRM